MSTPVVLFRDGFVLAVDKPAGLAVHGGAGRSGPTLQSIVRALPDLHARNDFEATAVHRLDAGTSGIVLFALRRPAMRALTEAWMRGDVHKTYVALVTGAPATDHGTIDLPLDIDGKVRDARTTWRILERRGDRTLVECDPHTGRKHQLRRHLAHLGHPIVGDDTYGGPAAPRLFLHARRLDFPHPAGKGRVVVACEVPPEFRDGAAAQLPRGS